MLTVAPLETLANPSMAEQLSEHQRMRIVRLRFVDGKKLKTIARDIPCAESTVKEWIKTFLATNHVERKHGSGRPPVMDEELKDDLDRLVSRNRTATSTALAPMLERKTGRRVSARTIHRTRSTLGYHPVHAKVRPFLNAGHIDKRLAFCRAHVTDNINGWVFADECGLELDSHNRVYWIKQGETRPHEFSMPTRVRINVWAAITRTGRSLLWTGKESMNAERYVEVLGDHLGPLLPWGRKKLVHDRAPFHTARVFTNWATDQKISILSDFPPRSPDLNAIEYVWSWLKHTVSTSHPTSAEELTTAIHGAWDNLPQLTITNYIDHIKTVMRQVVAAEGGNTD